MNITTFIFIALAAGAAVGALFVALFNLQASRLTETLFDALECALAERRQRRLEYRADEAPRAVRIKPAPRRPGLTLVARSERAAA